MKVLSATDRRILKLAVPAFGALAVEPAYVLVDAAIVGRIGTAELAGVGVAAAVLGIVFAGSNFLTYGTTEQIARRLGANDKVGAADTAVQTVWLSAIVGVAAGLAIGIGAPLWASLFGAEGAVLDAATTYLRVSALGIPAILLTLGCQGILRGESRYTEAMWVLVVANIANVLIELVFVFGLGMGVTGSALSTVLAQIGAAAGFVYLCRRSFPAATSKRPEPSKMAPLMTAGRSLLLRVGSMLVVVAGSTAIANRFGTVSGAAQSVVMTMFVFLALVLDALAVPAHTLVGQAFGRGDARGAREVADRCARLSLVAGGLLAIGVVAGSGWIPTLFTPDAAVAGAAQPGMFWLGIALVPGSVAFALDGALIGSGDYKFLGRAALGYTIAVAPLGAVLLARPELGIGGIWGAFALWMLLRAVVNRWRVENGPFRQIASRDTP